MPGRGQRLDKWLWFAGIVKTRTRAGRLIEGGKVRVNRLRVSKSSRLVKEGDVVTAAIHGSVRVLRIASCGVRRGPAMEAQKLYIDISPLSPPLSKARGLEGMAGGRLPGRGRPTKRDRRRIDKIMHRR